MTAVPESDASVLSGNRPRRTFAAGDVVLDDLDSPDEILLLLAGSAVLAAETPIGPHPVATLRAPALLNLKRGLAGSPGLFRILPSARSEAAVFTSSQACDLLFDTGDEGKAFRRFALGSVTTALRETNASLARFFDDMSLNTKAAVRDSGELPALPQAVPVDPGQVYDLFDAAGLNPSGLPDLGLIARRLAPEATLVSAGTQGDEAFLLAEGRLRVSMRIPGVGEEALAVLGPGEIVGEMALIDDAPRSATVRAHEGPALVYVLSRAVFRNLLDSGDPAGAPLLAGITIALTRRHEEAIRKAATFRVLAGPF